MMDDTNTNAQRNDPTLPPVSASAETERIQIPVIEEQLQIDKQLVETGRIRIAKTVREEEQTVDIPLLREEFNVERVAINQYVDAAPAVRQEGDTTVYPVVKEVLVIEKKLVLVEEVHITKRQVETSEPQQVTVRKEEVTVERLTNGERPA